MDKSILLGNILASSIKNLFTNQPNLSKFTSQTGETEWNLGHHFANEIAKYIFWLDYDLDVTKRTANNRRPDIIFHKRGTNNNNSNFLVVELKRQGNSTTDDIAKIKDYWMGNELHYLYGASIILDVDKQSFEITLFTKNKKEIIKEEYDYIPLPIDRISQENFKNQYNS